MRTIIAGLRQRKNLPLVSAMVGLLVVLFLLSPSNAMALEITQLTTQNENMVVIFSIGNSTYTVNGESQTMDVAPTIIENRTLLPIRYAATPLGAEVDWDEATRKVTVSLGATVMELWIGQNNALINGKTVPIDTNNVGVKPLIINGRTMLPLRFVTENLGCDVQWDPETKKVTIASGDSSEKTGKMPDVEKEPGKIPDIKLLDQIPEISKDLGKTPDPEEEAGKQIPDVSKLPKFQVPGEISAPDYEVLYINDTAYYENYFGTVLTVDTGMLTTSDDTYKWGVTNNKDMSLQYFTFFLKPAGKYEKFRASFFLDSSAKADLVMNIKKENKDGMVLKSLTLKPGETLENVTVDISGVNKICIESELRINHGVVKKIVVGEPIFYNSKQ